MIRDTNILIAIWLSFPNYFHFSEHGIFREEIRSLEMVKMKMSDRIRELEADIKELKEKKSQEESSEEQVKVENLKQSANVS